ncbi:MAG: LTA synthase family protein [Firmicutes bacterium]|nr:LTA synthase family protein [Bacillota bacterium]
MEEKQKHWRLPAWLGIWLVLACQEMITQLMIFGRMTWGMFYGAVFAVPAAGLLTVLTSLFSKKANRILRFVLLLIPTIFFGAQIVYYDIFKTFMQVFSIGHGVGNAINFFSVVLESLSRIWWKILLVLLPFVAYSVLPSRLRRDERRRWQHVLAVTVMSVLLHFVALGSLFLAGTGSNTPHEQYFGKTRLMQAYQKLGVLTSMRIDLQHHLFGYGDEPDIVIIVSRPESSAEESSREEVISKEESANESLPDSSAEESSVPEEPPFEGKPVVLDIDFDHLIETAPGERIANMHRYFQSVEPSYTNKYTGMFEGYNLIWLICEAWSKWTIDEKLTPTLYKMANQNCFVFEHFYTPYFAMSTLDGEYVTMTSLLPKEDVWSYYVSSFGPMPFGFGNMMVPMGYTCRGYHDHHFDMYRRDLSHPNMGYIWKGWGNGLNVDYTWPESDLQMMQLSVSDYVDKEPFHVYYLTVSGHVNWNWTGNAMCIKHRDEVQDLPYDDEEIKAYLACNIELDLALQYLLEQLEEAGVADHTVIAMSADHYPYGMDVDQLSVLDGSDLSKDFEMYKNAFLLYCPGMEETVHVDKIGSSLDIAPTLANLFNLPVDSRLYMGRDLLSDAEPLVIMADHSFFNDKILYDASTGRINYRGEEAMSPTEIKAYAERLQTEVNNKYAMSEAVLMYDYYGYLQDYLPWWNGKSYGRLYDPALDD